MRFTRFQCNRCQRNGAEETLSGDMPFGYYILQKEPAL